MEKAEKTRKVTKYVPLVTFQIKEGATTKDKKEYHICDAFDDIEDAFNDGVKYRYHETRIGKNDGAIVFILSDIACWQLFRRLVSLKPEKIKSFSIFALKDLLNGTVAEKLDDSLIKELVKKLDENSIKTSDKMCKDAIDKLKIET